MLDENIKVEFDKKSEGIKELKKDLIINANSQIINSKLDSKMPQFIYSKINNVKINEVAEFNNELNNEGKDQKKNLNNKKRKKCRDNKTVLAKTS